MADRGFLIREELLCRGASLVIPAFTKGKISLAKGKSSPQEKSPMLEFM